MNDDMTFIAFIAGISLGTVCVIGRHIYLAIVSLKPSYHQTFSLYNTTSVCQRCGKPIYYALGSEIWWEIHEPKHGFDRGHVHLPIGVQK